MKARQAFERLGSKYGDTSWVAQARTKLVGFRSGQTGRQTTTVVWSDAKVDPDETISPDGRYISYPDWKTGNLAVHDFQTGTDRALTTDGAWKLGEAEFSEDSAFSRDGKQVTYAWYQKKTNRFELRIVNFTGEPKPRKLFESAEMRYVSPQDWSPDGKWIASQPGAGELRRQDRRAGAARNEGGARFGGSARRVATHDQDGGVDRTRYRLRKDSVLAGRRFLAYDRPTAVGSRQRSGFSWN